MGTSRAPVVFAAGLSLAVAVLAACSGSSVSSIGGGDGDGGNGMTSGSAITSGSVPSADGATPDGASPDGSDPVVDAGIVVNELPAPQCNDLTQHGAVITPTPNPAQPPAQVPIATIVPGLYVLVSTTDYGGSTVIQPSTNSKTTTVFTATRQYYLSETTGRPAQVLSLDWSIKDNRLLRKVTCAQSPAQVGTSVDYRIDAAADGFIVYVDSASSGTSGMRTQAFHYARKN